MQLFDSHAHITNLTDIKASLQNAYATNVFYILNVNTSMTDLSKAISIKNPHDEIIILNSIAIPPQDIDEKTDLEYLENQIIDFIIKNKNIIYAIGETGLDAPFKSNEDFVLQHKALNMFYKIAYKFDLPMIFHCRNAFDELIEFIKSKKWSREYPGVIHCFTGSLDHAETLIALGWFISISGIITFKNSHNLQNIVKSIPITKILIETDCPYLAPVPFRGKENEPAFVIEVAKKIAELKDLTLEDVIIHTTRNAKNLFLNKSQPYID